VAAAAVGVAPATKLYTTQHLQPRPAQPRRGFSFPALWILKLTKYNVGIVFALQPPHHFMEA
jgi:hypothetical protein